MVQAGKDMESSVPNPKQQDSPQPDAKQIGREFVRQYYTMLAEHPKYVHRFYSNDSIFIHCNSDGIVGQQAIQKKIQELCYDQCQAKIKKVEACEAPQKGVVIQVLGELSCNGNPGKRFHQTFVLAPQTSKKYYVFNDIFQYADEVFTLDDRPSSTTALDGTYTGTGEMSMQEPREAILNGNVPHEEIVTGPVEPQQLHQGGGPPSGFAMTQAPMPQRRARQDSNMSGQGGGEGMEPQRERTTSSTHSGGFQMDGGQGQGAPPPPPPPEIQPPPQTAPPPPQQIQQHQQPPMDQVVDAGGQMQIQTGQPVMQHHPGAQQPQDDSKKSWARIAGASSASPGTVVWATPQVAPPVQQQPDPQAEMNQTNQPYPPQHGGGQKEGGGGYQGGSPQPVHQPVFKGGKELFVGNIPSYITYQNTGPLFDFFSQFGKVLNVRVPNMRSTDMSGRAKQPIAFVSFDNPAPVKDVLDKAYAETVALSQSGNSRMTRVPKLMLSFSTQPGSEHYVNVEEKRDRSEDEARRSYERGGGYGVGGEFGRGQGEGWRGGGPPRRGGPSGAPNRGGRGGGRGSGGGGSMGRGGGGGGGGPRASGGR